MSATAMTDPASTQPASRPDDRVPAWVRAAGDRTVVVRLGDLSTRLDPRSIVVCLVLIGLILVAGCWSLMLGDFPLSVTEALSAVVGNGTDDADFVVNQLRLPRTLTAILVGAALGMSGAIFQSLTRNPLGSPDIVGFQQGSALGAVIVVVLVGGGERAIAAGAIGGGVLTALIVFVLAHRGGVSAGRLVLMGIGIGFTATAGVDYLLTRAKITDVQQAAVWLTGSFNGRNWSHVATAGLAVAVAAPLVVLASRRLDRLALGDDTAAALGLSVGRSKLFLVVLGVGLASLAVAAAGPIAFTALVAAPIARRLVDSASACLVPAACVGALLTVLADLAGRRVFAPTELPAGIATAVIGTPYLIWLLQRRARSGAL